MRSTLATLKRVRDIHKKVSRQAFVTAERNRIEQEGVVVRVEERIRATYEVDAGITAGSMMQVHDWRTKLSSDLVREEDLLRSRVESANRRRDDLRELGWPIDSDTVIRRRRGRAVRRVARYWMEQDFSEVAP